MAGPGLVGFSRLRVWLRGQRRTALVSRDGGDAGCLGGVLLGLTHVVPSFRRSFCGWMAAVESCFIDSGHLRAAAARRYHVRDFAVGIPALAPAVDDCERSAPARRREGTCCAAFDATGRARSADRRRTVRWLWGLSIPALLGSSRLRGSLPGQAVATPGRSSL